MLISRIVALSCGSLTSWFVAFIISVDFWNAPVTLTIAAVSHATRIPTQLVLQLHVDRVDARLGRVQPIALLVRAHNLLGEDTRALDVVLLRQRLELRARLECCAVELGSVANRRPYQVRPRTFEISRSTSRWFWRSFRRHSRTRSSGVGPYSHRLMLFIAPSGGGKVRSGGGGEWGSGWCRENERLRRRRTGAERSRTSAPGLLARWRWRMAIWRDEVVRRHCGWVFEWQLAAADMAESPPVDERARSWIVDARPWSPASIHHTTTVTHSHYHVARPGPRLCQRAGR